MPVSALQEFLQKRGEPIPVYSETVGGPPFTVTVRCGDITVDHVGASKKDAKHKAAEAMLIKLTKGTGISVSRSTGNHDSNLLGFDILITFEMTVFPGSLDKDPISRPK